MTGPALLASILLVALGVAAAVLRRRGGIPGVPPPVAVEARLALSRDAGVAVLRAGGDALLVGWGRDGVRLLARLRDGGPQ